jgi:hypothetical protein
MRKKKKKKASSKLDLFEVSDAPYFTMDAVMAPPRLSPHFATPIGTTSESQKRGRACAATASVITEKNLNCNLHLQLEKT